MYIGDGDVGGNGWSLISAMGYPYPSFISKTDTGTGSRMSQMIQFRCYADGDGAYIGGTGSANNLSDYDSGY